MRGGLCHGLLFFFSSGRRHTRWPRDWSSDVCSSDLLLKSNATLVAKVDQIEDKIQNAQGATEQTNYRLDRMTQQLTQTQHDVDELKAGAARAAAAVAPVPNPTPSSGEMTVQPSAATSEDPMQTY